MNEVKFTFITNSELNGNGIGSIYNRDLFNNIPSNYSYFVKIIKPYLSDLAIFSKIKLGVLLFTALNRFGLIQKARLKFFQLYRLNSLKNELLSEKRNEFFWITLSTPELIYLAESLVISGIKIKVTVWDPPELLAQYLHLDVAMAEDLRKRFEVILKASSSVIVVSNNMKNFYFEKYNSDSVVIRHVVSDEYLKIENHNDKNDQIIKIGFAGSLYSKKEWNSFISTLDMVNWRILGFDVELHFIGDYPLTDVIESRKIIKVGRLTFYDTAMYLSKLDIGYVPYWLSEDKYWATFFSFPGKVSLYTAVGLKIFNHGPSHSELTNFLSQYKYGVSCNSYESEAILNALHSLVKISKDVVIDKSRIEAFKMEFSYESIIKKINFFLTS